MCLQRAWRLGFARRSTRQERFLGLTQREHAARVNGPIDDLLFPIQHGMLFYPGMQVLPPFVEYHTGRMNQDCYASVCHALGRRLDTLLDTAPIPFRGQNAGDYAIPALTLKDQVVPGRSGFAAHLA